MLKLISKSVFAHRKEAVGVSAIFLLFTITLLFSSQLISFFSAFSIKKEGVQIEEKTQQELQGISQQREEIIASRVLNDAIKNNDLSQLGIIMQAELKKRNLDFIVVTDKDGFVLARSGLSVQQGDNVFQTTIQGRGVAQGETVTAIVRGIGNPLTSISNSFIFEQNKPIGSILVGRIFDTKYANYFQQNYLKQGGQIVFYTPQEGIVGDSFYDVSKTQLISAYFSLGSDLVVQNLAGLANEVEIDGSFYAVRHIVFPGIGTEESPGGAFVFFPINHSFYSLFLAGGITALLLILLCLLFLFKILDHPKNSILIFFLWAGVILFIGLYFVTLVKLNHSAIELKKSPYLIYNSTIKFDPESDVISRYSEKTIAIKVVTGGELINVVNVVAHYDTTTVKILDIITKNSLCDPAFFIEKEIDVENGEVRIICGVPIPGFDGATGIVAEILVQPLSLQPIFLTFSTNTQILASDGLGTNVLRAVTDGFYQVVRQKFASADTLNPIPIFSPSHPNSNRWYKNKKVRLSWPELLGGTYYYSLSKSIFPSTEDKVFSTTNNYFGTSVNDGIYYFHLYAKDAEGKSGPLSSFKIRIDATPPSAPKIQASSEVVSKGDIVRLDFTSKDSLSGLQSGFYVKINEGIFFACQTSILHAISPSRGISRHHSCI